MKAWKYVEDTNLPTIANRFANIVVDYEKSKNVNPNEVDDLDIEDDVEYGNKSQQLIYYSSSEEEEHVNFKKSSRNSHEPIFVKVLK